MCPCYLPPNLLLKLIPVLQQLRNLHCICVKVTAVQHLGNAPQGREGVEQLTAPAMIAVRC
jgi:hypothetical protein